ncbi:3-phenylpropionate/trans-cinnamate dioxygenase ferredoxin reductase subunit [Thermocatellispora tengchongensis]|uniref:3-phenylpropionate/trans-cinnamate dioxygenase ferredoxin reductase subunit n=1 Tax=Thermocatellispora tengchongensis TaxID=1073253 RepID=A0A840P6J8_9ACTN|nr:FAD-dependent oxidoreductase [Thermocatellispora tengchongensis]MBB5131635.1 3-phenylpropionate/trans-cinnamate dioxygenase ferredoxin reductase subunit [Thermocatellispora tengchongensis]
MNHVVVVGAGLAGVRSVEALRAHGFGGRITLIGEERHRPYDRPPLSKAVLAGEADSTFVESDLDAMDVGFRPGVSAKGLRPGVVETTEGELPYDGLVIATGATPIRLRGEGPQHVLRTIDDALALRELFAGGPAVAVVGAGWIGAEVATAARKAGCEVTVVEAGDAPLAVALGAETGAYTIPWYERAGVRLLLSTRVATVDPDGITLADGTPLKADVVVTGVGVRPAVGWLDGSGIRLDNGVVTDEHLRTSLPGVVAVGDCAAWWSRRFRTRLRVEHWDTALGAPDVAAASLLGEDAVYDPVPYFWSEQFGHMVQYAGHHQAAARRVLRGDPAADPKWAICWLTADDRLAAILTVDRPRDLVQGRRLVEGGQRLDVERLMDPAITLRDCSVA